jgi:copper transport protein
MTAVEVAIGWMDLAATTVLVGGSVYASLVEVPGASGRRCLRAAASLLAAALVLEIASNSLRMHRVSGIGGAKLFADVLGMKWTRWWALRAAALAALALGLGAARPRWSVLAGIGTASLLARSLQGHAGAHGLIPVLADWAHLSAATVWVGGLVQLAVLPTVPAAVAVRASRAFTLALFPLIACGVYGAVLHVEALGQLLATPYGRVLLGKTTLAAWAIALGAVNHYRRVPSLARGEADGSQLVRAVRTEVVVLAVVLSLSVLLGNLPMPHATASGSLDAPRSIAEDQVAVLVQATGEAFDDLPAQ